MINFITHLWGFSCYLFPNGLFNTGKEIMSIGEWTFCFSILVCFIQWVKLII
jgi:hypothetical protein